MDKTSPTFWITLFGLNWLPPRTWVLFVSRSRGILPYHLPMNLETNNGEYQFFRIVFVPRIIQRYLHNCEEFYLKKLQFGTNSTKTINSLLRTYKKMLQEKVIQGKWYLVVSSHLAICFKIKLKICFVVYKRQRIKP